MKIIAAKKILKENDRQASELREQFEKTGTFVVNLVGSPGCGKTTLLEALFDQLDSQLTLGVIEGGPCKFHRRPTDRGNAASKSFRSTPKACATSTQR